MHQLLGALYQCRHDSALPSIVWGSTKKESTEILRKKDDEMRAFYSMYFQTCPDADAVRTLLQFVFSLPAGGTAVESQFSGTGRLNAPHRNRMSVEAFEKLAIVKNHVSTNGANKVLKDLEERIRDGSPVWA